MNTAYVRNTIISSCVGAFLISSLLLLSFFTFEPVVSHGASADTQFLVTQEITAEISITAAPDVTMAPTIAGITGGTANGQTQVVVTTNNNDGYTLAIDFASSSYGTAAMNRNGGGGDIDDYATSTEADFGFRQSTTLAQFAFSVTASTSNDVATAFEDNGSTCGNADTGNTGNCWMGPSSTASAIIINTGAATPVSGSTSTVKFRVHVPSDPSPAIPTGFYTATTTLTATTK